MNHQGSKQINCSYSALRKFHGFIRASCVPFFTCSHPLEGIVINDRAWWFLFVKVLASLGLDHQGHHPWLFFPSSIMWFFLKRHISFEFFTQNPPKLGWWNWSFCLKRLLNPRVHVLYHASHSPKVSWTCAKSFIGFFNLYIFDKIINKVYFNCKSLKGHKIRPSGEIWSWGCSFLDP